MTCTDCPAFKICPEKPVREDYEDENKYLIDLESGVWSCQKTIKKLYKENEQQKEQIKKLKEGKQYETCPYRSTDMKIDKEEFEKASFEEKQSLVNKILRLDTHNAFSKDDLLFVIKWQNAAINSLENCENCKHYKYTLRKYKCSLNGCNKKSMWEFSE